MSAVRGSATIGGPPPGEPEDTPGEAGPPTGPPDLRLVPLAAATWVGAWLATSGQAVWVLLGAGVGALGLVVAGWRRGLVTGASAALLLVSLGSGWVQHATLDGSAVARLAEERAVVRVEAVVISDFRRVGTGREEILIARGRLLAVEGRGRRIEERVPVLVVSRWSAPLGARLRFSARAESREPGDDVAAVLRLRSPPVSTGAPSAGQRVVERIRGGLRTAMAHRPPAQRALVPALVLGDVSAMPAELVDRFKMTGLSHLTAVSGANLAILVTFVTAIAVRLGLRGGGVRVVSLVCVAVFVGLCRTEPSVLRAAAMGLVTIAAVGSGARGGRALRHLALAGLVLVLVEPWLARSFGMALSVLACLGIVLWASAWSDRASRWMPRVIAVSIAVPLAAQVLTTPLVALLSQRVSLSSLPANMMAGPFVGPATVAGFAAAGLSIFSPALAAAAGTLAGWSAQGIVWTAELWARLPGASMAFPAQPVALLVLLAAGLLAAGLAGWVLQRPWLVGVLTLALFGALLVTPPQPGFPVRGWQVIFCDVGQGDATLLAAGAGQAVVVDVGPDPAAVLACLDRAGVRRIPLLVLTHFHADHVAGLAAVLASRGVGEVVSSPLASPAGEASRVSALLARHGVPERVAPESGGATVGGVTLRFVGAHPQYGPVPTGAVESEVENDSSVVLAAEVGPPGRRLSLLLPGDIELDRQARILAGPGVPRVAVVKLPHHGSANLDPRFLAATGASVALASCGIGNDYGHPAPRTLRLAEGLNMRVLRTDEQGSIAIARDGASLRVATQRAGP